MKIASLIARYLLGLVFLIFGLNGFLHFIPMPPPTGVALDYFKALSETNLVVLIFGVQLLCGLLFLLGQYVPLALTLIGPVIVNILWFHFSTAPSGLPLALLVTILWFLVFWYHREHFAGIFRNVR